ncbi:hypothetical protein [Carnobacterium maltaromaticum]|uniref:hypothetical protein n=1 Tax=Carnobacterium maltaromaticum TaxID=2751 RepID=UPI00295F2304|nr:hypothetical protein [Carnobacterium maltaromaticum]
MKKKLYMKVAIALVTLLSVIGVMLSISNTGDLKKVLINTEWEIQTSEGISGKVKFGEKNAVFYVQDDTGKEEEVTGAFQVNNYTRELKIKNNEKKIIISVANTGPNEFEKGWNSASFEGFLDYLYPKTIGGMMIKIKN